MTHKLASFLVLSILLCHIGTAQIREVESRASSYKSSSSSKGSSSDSHSSNFDSDDYFFMFDLLFEMFRPMVKGISLAQRRQLEQASSYAWRTGVEFNLYGGLNFSQPYLFNSQVIRGNYGLFSTQIRRFSLSDVSGSFNTIDWQVVQLNLINTQKVRWILGGGFSHEIAVDQEHFEWTSELHVLIKKSLVPRIAYRRSDDGYPRREFSVMIEYRPFSERKSQFAFDAGYLHQKVYGLPFDFTSFGISYYLK